MILFKLMTGSILHLGKDIGDHDRSLKFININKHGLASLKTWLKFQRNQLQIIYVAYIHVRETEHIARSPGGDLFAIVKSGIDLSDKNT